MQHQLLQLLAMAPPAGTSTKRPLAAALSEDGRDAAAAAEEWRREASAMAGALIPYVAPPPPPQQMRLQAPASDGHRPIRAVPLAAVALAQKKVAMAAAPVEPGWIRERLLANLGLTCDQPVVFIHTKMVTSTDLDPHQNRFRLPTSGVRSRLLPMLTLDEARAANLLEDGEEPRPKKRRRTEKGSAIADGEQKQGMPPPPPPPGVQQQGEGEGTTPAGTKRQPSRRKGKAHGGVPVTVFHLYAGMRQLSLVLWESSNGTIIKGNGYMDFINRTGLKEHDTVHIWAIKRRGFRLFGATVPESPFYVVIVGGSRRTFEAPPPLCMLPPPQ